MKPFSAEIRPLLSLFQSAGPLLHHKQLGLMSFDLTLMTDSASVPAGRRADGSATESHANSYLQQLREQFSFLQFSQRISTGMFSAVVAMDKEMMQYKGREEGEDRKRGGPRGRERSWQKRREKEKRYYESKRGERVVDRREGRIS